MAAPRFLFVHGAWHGAWCFDLIGLELQRRAVSFAAVDLPSMGDDGTPVDSATFEAGVERVVGMISGRKPILVGHSFGAMYATEAAIRSGKAYGVVYLASYIPVPGDTYQAMDELAPIDEELRGGIQRDADSASSVLAPEAAQQFLYPDVPEGIAAAAVARLKPQPLEPFRSAVISPVESLGSLKRRAILAEEDRVIRPEHGVAMAERAGIQVETIPTGHCPFLTMPKLLADQLLGVA